jgi:hypothetical protein
LGLSTPLRLDSKTANSSTMATANSSDSHERAARDGEGRGQQSPLASERAKEQGEQQQGRFAQWFPLGAKEGFSQWVSRTMRAC